MIISLICYDEKAKSVLMEGLSKIEFGVKVLTHGDFLPSFENYKNKKINRGITKAVLEASDDKADYIVLYLGEGIDDLEFLSNLTDADIYRVRFDDLDDSDKIASQTDFICKKISDIIDHKLFNMYEAEGCGCSACRGLHH